MEEWQDLGAKTKTQALRERLTDMSRSLGPGARFPTVNEMISSFKVSVSTLDRILAELERDGIIERKRGRGIYVSNKSSKKVIGIVCDIEISELLNTFYCGMIIRSLQRLIEDSGCEYQLFIDLRPDKDGIPTHSEFSSLIMRGDISGVCYIGGFYPKMLEWTQKKVPVTVVFGTDPIARHRLQLDYPHICRIGTREIIRLGAKRPALIPYWDMDGELFKSCSSAFLEELSSAGLQASPDMVWRSGLTLELENNEAQGYRAIMELFRTREKAPDGIMSIDDMMTRGAIAGLSALGLHPGEDVKIVSHVNKGSPSLDLFRNHLSLVEIDLEEIAGRMVSTLNKIMRGEKPPSNDLISCAKIISRA